MSQQAAEALRAYPFPGNVRELENALTHAAALASDRLISVDCLPSHIAQATGAKFHEETQTAAPDIISDWPTMEELQRRYLELVLGRHEGNRSRAAAALGLDRRTVQRMLAKYQIASSSEDEADEDDEL
jgi:two-component system response regulator AtoC